MSYERLYCIDLTSRNRVTSDDRFYSRQIYSVLPILSTLYRKNAIITS
jgi:hypothetical protein